MDIFTIKISAAHADAIGACGMRDLATLTKCPVTVEETGQHHEAGDTYLPVAGTQLRNGHRVRDVNERR